MSEDLKRLVREKYNQIAQQSKVHNEPSCCSSKCCDKMNYTMMSDDYSSIEGYNKEADLGLGCGIPTEYANISKDDVVVDLGSGAGNDAFVARSIVGDGGKVIGIDFAGAMLTKARKNAIKLGYNNVEFIRGDIEDMPLDSNLADIVISNCVLNLVPDKEKAFEEMFRVLKPGGHFCVSDIVLTGELPYRLVMAAEMYAGCISGAIQKEEYLNIITEKGFKNLEIIKEKKIMLPDHILLNYLSMEGLESFYKSNTGIFSITVYAEK